jgi:crossover junction endodeoxyribonuclease RusA
MAEVIFDVLGDPASQGSHAIMQGRIVQVNSKKHKAWRKAITDTALAHLPLDWEPIDDPCELLVHFYLPKPASVKRSLPSVSPDLDKLIRAVGDSLTDAGVVKDDSRIVWIRASKSYASGSVEPGATIQVKTLD